jgi:hypothetical protein
MSAAGASAPLGQAAATAGDWAVFVAGAAEAAWAVAAALRLHAGIEAAPGHDGSGEGLWVRGEGGGAALAADLRRAGLRACARRDGRAWHEQAPLPVAVLPVDGWRSLRAATVPRLGVAALPAAMLTAHPLRLVAAVDGADAAPAAMVLPLAEFAGWAEDAPAHRLEALRFALAPDGGALVMGTPLPPVPGRRFWRHGALLLPCGWVLDPPCAAGATARVFALAADELAVVREGSWHRLPAAAVVPARRAAVRAALSVAAAAGGTP